MSLCAHFVINRDNLCVLLDALARPAGRARLFTMYGLRPLRNDQSQTLHLTMPRRQTLFISGYILYLALVLPFICWGALANPGHPHQGAHFVFSMPPGVEAPGVEAQNIRLEILRNEICGNPKLSSQIPLPAFGGDANDDGPAGQSLPATVLAMLALAFVGSALYCVHWIQQSERLATFRTGPIFQPLIPTPPPRFS